MVKSLPLNPILCSAAELNALIVQHCVCQQSTERGTESSTWYVSEGDFNVLTVPSRPPIFTLKVYGALEVGSRRPTL